VLVLKTVLLFVSNVVVYVVVVAVLVLNDVDIVVGKVVPIVV
tara:strand:+ start:1414 stop:1539 length:126 start_codon:yes stop_codon:yes gene_type:complete